MNPERQRKLAAIMFTDIVGYSRAMSIDEDHALRLLDEHDAVLSLSIAKFGGTILKRMGDAIFAEFVSATSAVRCGIDIQHQIKAHNQECAPNDTFCIRIGIHLGDVIVHHEDLFGDGINVAARLQPLAQPGGICISQAVFQAVKKSGDIEPVLVGEVELKNILERHVIYQFPPFYEMLNESQQLGDSTGSVGKGLRIRLARAEKLPPAKGGLHIIVQGVIGLLCGMLLGAAILSTTQKGKAIPFLLLHAEVRDPRHIVAALSQSQSSEVTSIWRLVSVKGREELRTLQSADQSESNDYRMKEVLVQELNKVIRGTYRLDQSVGGADGMTAAANRRKLESLFPDQMSVLLAPRTFLETVVEDLRRDTTLMIALLIVFLVVFPAFSIYFVSLERPAITRYVFDDIRGVDDLIEYLVRELGFKPPLREGKSLVFRATVATYLTWGARKFNARIDGNAVTVSGPAILVKRLTKSLFALNEDGALVKHGAA